MVASFPIRADVFTINCFCQDPRAGCLADPPWTTKQKGVRQLPIFNGVFQGSGDMQLAHDGRKILGPVLAGTDDEFVHFSKPTTNPLNNLRSPFGDLKRFFRSYGSGSTFLPVQHSKFSGDTSISFIVPNRYALKINCL
jgi:hypothetical protein